MSHIHAPKNRPIRLRPNNFTPPTRTPWGGRRIPTHYKAGLLDGLPEGAVGESWELSVEPDFPSWTTDGEALASLLAREPSLTGDERGSTALLVKLLDTAEPLSVQIHPRDDDPALAADESGKPESWYVLHAEPGAGLYLGLAEGVDEPTMRDALATGADVSRLLRFVPVEPGDFFVIDAGTPHAIGAGLTLVEPQRVTPGRRGLTYRYWDWNRRYDAEGRPDPKGAPRALHVERALAVTAWGRCEGDAWLASIRRRAGVPALDAPARVDALTTSAHGEGVEFPWLGAARLAGDGRLPLAPMTRLRALTVAEGAVTVRTADGATRFVRGETAALPAALEGELELERAHALLSWVGSS